MGWGPRALPAPLHVFFFVFLESWGSLMDFSDCARGFVAALFLLPVRVVGSSRDASGWFFLASSPRAWSQS